MALNTRFKRPGIAQSLMSSDDVTTTSGLHGIVPPDTQTSLDKMSYFLGLGTAMAVKEWMQSSAFKPHFDELYNSLLKPQQERAESQNKAKKQGPQLQIVQATLIDGERHGDERYSGCYIDKQDWTEVDYYALCLYRLRKANTNNRNGVFRNASLSVAEMESRLWCAMLRASYEMAKSRQDRGKSSDNLPTSPAGGQGATKDGDDLSPSKKLRLSSDRSTSTITQAALHPGQASTASPLVISAFQTAGGACSTATNEQGPSGVLQNVDDKPDNSSSGIDSKSTPADSDIPPMDECERMRSEGNMNNPLDCSTDFRRYLTIHIVVKHFNDPFEIQRLFAQTPTSPGGAADLAADQTRIWHDELEAIAKSSVLPYELRRKMKFQSRISWNNTSIIRSFNVSTTLKLANA